MKISFSCFSKCLREGSGIVVLVLGLMLGVQQGRAFYTENDLGQLFVPTSTMKSLATAAAAQGGIGNVVANSEGGGGGGGADTLDATAKAQLGGGNLTANANVAQAFALVGPNNIVTDATNAFNALNSTPGPGDDILVTVNRIQTTVGTVNGQADVDPALTQFLGRASTKLDSQGNPPNHLIITIATANLPISKGHVTVSSVAVLDTMLQNAVITID